MTVTATPQNLVALRHGHELRLARMALRREIVKTSRRTSAMRVAELLENPPEQIATIAIIDLLMWVYKVGRLRARRLLGEGEFVPISEQRQVRELTERQRRALAERVRDLAEVVM